eukprot:4430475-Lingulodinium_polyedra.AAC.1
MAARMLLDGCSMAVCMLCDCGLGTTRAARALLENCLSTASNCLRLALELGTAGEFLGDCLGIAWETLGT